jgi:hypothetical protein
MASAVVADAGSSFGYRRLVVDQSLAVVQGCPPGWRQLFTRLPRRLDGPGILCQLIDGTGSGHSEFWPTDFQFRFS